MEEIINEAKRILSQPDPARQKRINKMVAIYKHGFKWSRKTFIDKVMEWIPELAGTVKGNSTMALYAAMSIKQMNDVLTRLEAIEARNKKEKRANG